MDGRGRDDGPDVSDDDDVDFAVNRRSVLKLAGVSGALVAGGIGLFGGDTAATMQPVTAYGFDGATILDGASATVTTAETEPNDSRVEATSIRTNVRVTGELTAEEVDFFAVDVGKDEPLTVEFDRDDRVGVTGVALYGPDGGFLNMLYVGSDSPVALQETTTRAGTHYVQVIDVNGGNSPYSLVVKDSDYETPTPDPTPTATPDPTPEPSDHIWMEAESASDGADFSPFEVHSDANASGGEYITTPDEGQNNYGGAPSDGRASYTFSTPSSGEYALWARVKGQSNGNSFYLSLDDGPTTTFHTSTGGWTWEPLPLSTVDLSAGTHTLTVTHREDGTALDRLLVTADIDFEPGGTGGESGATTTPTATPDPTPTSTPTATPTPTPTPTPEPEPTEHVWLEAESAEDGSAFAPFEVRSDGDASGGEYITTQDEGRTHLGDPPADGRASYTFSAGGGSHVVWGRVRASSGSNDADSFYLSVNGGTFDEWHLEPGEWHWEKFGSVGLPAGTNSVSVAYREDGTALDKLLVTPDEDFVPSGTGGDGSSPSDGQTAYTDHDVSKIQAEDYDEGGEGVAYHDTSNGNSGSAYRDGDVDVQSTSDAGGGYNVGWVADGEWLEYSVDVPSGTYDLKARLASPGGGAKLRASLDGTALGTFEVPETGGWQTWQTVTLSGVSVPAGGVLRLEAAGDDFNVNWVSFVASDDETTETPTATPEPTPPPTPSPGDGSAEVTGELKQYHRVTVTFAGPSTSETADPNPFLDYRLDVTFTGPSGQTYDVPGFFDGDGNGGRSGNAWRVRFSPDEAGEWSYEASFRRGSRVAVSLDGNAGSPTSFDGATGTFSVDETDKSGPDLRAHGPVTNQGSHYFQHDDGTRWLKGGPNVPENFLGYEGFDNLPNASHDYSAHESDWNSGDPDWGDGDGKGIVGALNFIADEGGNSIYFLPMNLGGDGEDTFPFVGESAKTRYDVSKLEQWETTFAHAEAKGIHLHFLLAETESRNENFFDGGDLGPERKLFYREMVARFGHHAGVEWNVGEENDFGTTRHKRFCDYIRALDPYGHSTTTHNGGLYDMFEPLLGEGVIDSTAFQTGRSGDSANDLIREWRERSAANGEPWCVCLTEPQVIENNEAGYHHGRTDKMWPVYMGGGAGFEWYIQRDGGGHSFDQNVSDFREYESALEYTKHARAFFDAFAYWECEPQNDLLSNGDGYVLADVGETYAVYLPDGDDVDLDLTNDTYEYTWFDPENGDWRDSGTVGGGSSTDLGSPPFGGDAAILLERR
jgi:hypothetical protein